MTPGFVWRMRICKQFYMMACELEKFRNIPEKHRQQRAFIVQVLGEGPGIRFKGGNHEPV